jgi:sterol desaturase/sphingolipid hydroxylase (fatty acid hydroxylase superfamily)
MANLRFLFPLAFFLLLALEPLLPGRPQPRIRFWRLKCTLFFLIRPIIGIGVPAAMAYVLRGRTLLQLSQLPVAANALINFAVDSFIFYWVHRLMHRVNWLWRWTHQLHHSAERVDLPGFAFMHPLEMVVFVGTGSIVVAVLGSSPQAAFASGYALYLLGLFLHLNVRTPRWIGYIVQRPEMHAIHHQRGVHAYNYSIPVWDMLFGTFRNPSQCNAEAGFWDGASRKVGAMLVGRDVSAPSRV